MRGEGGLEQAVTMEMARSDQTLCILKVDPPEFVNGADVERREGRDDSRFPDESLGRRGESFTENSLNDHVMF